MSKKIETDKNIVIDRLAFRRQARRSLSSANYFNTFRDLTLVPGFKVTQAVFLSDLINREDMLHNIRQDHIRHGRKRKAAKVKIDEEEFFGCSIKYLQSRALPPIWTDEQQRDLIRVLKKKDFIKVKRVGRDGMRWIWVNHELIQENLSKIFTS